jgi:hypothetical protein
VSTYHMVQKRYLCVLRKFLLQNLLELIKVSRLHCRNVIEISGRHAGLSFDKRPACYIEPERLFGAGSYIAHFDRAFLEYAICLDCPRHIAEVHFFYNKIGLFKLVYWVAFEVV